MLRLLAQREAGYEDIATLMGLSVDQVRTMVRDSMAEIGGPLDPDQKAMLRLLAQREEGYEDIGALMGLSVDQVRTKVGESLAELGEPGKTPNRPAKEEAREPAAAATVPTTPATAATAGDSPTVKSEGSAPEQPAEKAPTTEPRGAGKKASAPRPSLALPKDQRLLAIGAGGAVALILILILVLSGGSSSSGTTTNTTATAPTGGSSSSNTPSTTPTNAKFTERCFPPSMAAARADERCSSHSQDARAAGRSPGIETFTERTVLHRLALPLAEAGAAGWRGQRRKSGGIAAQFPLPTQLLAYVASGAFNQIDISLTSNAAYAAEVAKAKKEKRLPQYTGTDILRGSITGPAVKK